MNFLAPYMAAVRIGAALALAALLAAAFLALCSHERDVGAAPVRAAWDRANQTAERARQARIEAARAEERRLQYAADEDRRKLNALRERDDAALRALRDELRDRPLRPDGGGRSDVRPGPPGPGAADGRTGAALYRDDAEFLVGVASVASAVLRERDACYAAYARAQGRLKAQ